MDLREFVKQKQGDRPLDSFADLVCICDNCKKNAVSKPCKVCKSQVENIGESACNDCLSSLAFFG